MDAPGSLFTATTINDMQVDSETNRITVYAQTRMLAKNQNAAENVPHWGMCPMRAKIPGVVAIDP